jgi:hypothetical protein
MRKSENFQRLSRNFNLANQTEVLHCAEIGFLRTTYTKQTKSTFQITIMNMFQIRI